MSTLTINQQRFIFTADDGKQTILLDTHDPFNNCSRVPFHTLTPDGQVESPLADGLQQYLQLLQQANDSTSPIAYMTVLLRVVQELLTRHRAYNLLQIGPFSTLSEILNDLLPQFHTDNSLTCLSNEPARESQSAIDFIQMNYEHLLLPTDHFHILFLDLPHMKPELLARCLLSLRDDGLLLWLTDPQTLPKLPITGTWQVLPVLPDCSLCTLRINRQQKDQLQAASPQKQQTAQKNSLCKKIAALKGSLHNILKDSALTPTELRTLDQQITELQKIEQEVCLLYANLPSPDCKFHLNELKEALIDYRLRNNAAENYQRTIKIHEKYQLLEQDFSLKYY